MTTGYNDTICAISTPRGVGGIAVARISGPQALEIAATVWGGQPMTAMKSHTAHYGRLIDSDGSCLDEAVATVFRTPRSFTGEDVVELSVHGSEWVQRRLIALLIERGARLAEAGEFTRRAFASGRLDLAQAEAVADLIASSSRAAHRVAMSQMRGEFSSRLAVLRDRLLELASLLELELDFSEEDVEFASRDHLLSLATEVRDETSRLADSFSTGKAIKDGIPVAIVGATNAGKSTLLNRLLHDDRAIVSDVHGTTRDVIEDTVEIDGILMRFIDTAGLRETTDTVETMGIERTLDRIHRASIVVWVVDATSAASDISEAWLRISPHLSLAKRLIILANKADASPDIALIDKVLRRLLADTQFQDTPIITGSARQGDLTPLETAIKDASGLADITNNDITVTNERHYQALLRANEAIRRAIDGLNIPLPGDLIAQDIRDTIHHLGEITGTITTDHILTSIFTRFCIGK
ncbi:MAG: tRNA uridine-5-carboxymethylaminomethyl(34) synthesis GTPase MnmE [Pseudoflavonifractor sp.]|nr:tRNA uridine-5-carboxymethylaminomethyl(34) synthesis GTPase MnmE [Pseudoflavonifractor sp.]